MIPISELDSIPFLDTTDLGDRFLTTLTFYDDDQWHMWLPVGANRDKIQKIQGFPAEMPYFGRTAEGRNDLYFLFLDCLVQRACFPGMDKPLNAITDDVQNLSASLAKLDLLFRSRKDVTEGLNRMAATEVEYIVVVCRSLFDFLQEFMCKLWQRIDLLDNSIHRQSLKKSFRQMIEFNGKPADADGIASRFGLPQNIAGCYEHGAEVFRSLKNLRDNIVHHGSSVPQIFVGDQCFLISEKRFPFTNMLSWEDHEREPNNLVPLLPAIQTLIYRTLATCNDFILETTKVIQLPKPIAPNMHLFLRGFFMSNLRTAIETGVARTQKIEDQSES